MNSIRARHNLIAVSANAMESAFGSTHALDTTMLVDVGDMINIIPRRESNADELTGLEEPDTIYDLGSTAEATFNFNKAQAQHFAFVCGFALGSVATTTSGTIKIHKITPISNDLDSKRSNPSFTAAQRYGLSVVKRLFHGMLIDSFTATFKTDDWVKLTAQIKGCGVSSPVNQVSVIEEEVTADGDAVSLTLANPVVGATAAERLDNVQRIRVELVPGRWTEVSFSAVSAATPAVVTISNPGGAGTPFTYKVLYAPGPAPAWTTFPARVSESPLRVAKAKVYVDGSYNGTAFLEGKTLTTEINSVEWSFNNNMQLEFAVGGTGYNPSRAFRDGRTQTLKLDREFRTYMMQQKIDNNETFSLEIECTGDYFPDLGGTYSVKIIFPKLGVLKAPITVNGKRLAEAGDLQVLEDSTYGSVIVIVNNQVSAYAA
jgi:hypothetical protein